MIKNITLSVDLNYCWKRLAISSFEISNQHLAKVTKVFLQTKKKNWLKTLGTGLIYHHLSSSSPNLFLLKENYIYLCLRGLPRPCLI